MKDADKPNNHNIISNEKRLDLPCFITCTTPWELTNAPKNTPGRPSEILPIIGKILFFYGYTSLHTGQSYLKKIYLGNYIYSLYQQDNTLNNMDYDKFNNLLQFNFPKNKFDDKKNDIINIIKTHPKQPSQYIMKFLKVNTKLSQLEYELTSGYYDYVNGLNVIKPKYIFLGQEYFTKSGKILELKNTNYKLISFSIVLNYHVTAYILDKESNNWYHYDDFKSDLPSIVKKNIDEIMEATGPNILYCYELQDEIKSQTVLNLICDYIKK
jgi:hypothetical protein